MSKKETQRRQQVGPPMGGGPMGMGRGGGKPKNFKASLVRLIKYLAPQKAAILFSMAAAVVSTVFAIFAPKVLGRATDKLFDGFKLKMSGVEGAAVDFGAIGQIILLVVVVYLVSSLFSYIQGYIMAGTAQKTVYRIRRDMNDKLNRLPLKYFDGRTHGEILSRVTNDIDNIANTLAQSLTQIITSVVSIVGYLVMMISISPTMTLIAVVSIPLYAIVAVVIAKKSQKQFSAQQKILGQLNGHVEEMYSGHRVVKLFGKEKDSIKAFDAMNDEYYTASWKAQFISGIIMPLMRFIGNLSYVFIAVLGAVFVSRGSITIGDIQAFIQYSNQFTQPIIQTSNIANVLQSTLASAERVFEVLDETEELPDAAQPKTIALSEGAVDISHVRFGYEEGKVVLNDMSINVKPGETVAIVGPTGAGKTTLVNLLMRFYEVNDGSITVDGVSLVDMTRADLRKRFGMVLQDTWLFNGTIRENIAYGKEGATEDEIVGAAKAAHADHFIRTLPDGYDTMLDEEAGNISQGQKQLLTIARAFLADPQILILDEATSNVDTRTEIQIQNAMARLMKDRTSFVIAHRLSTIRYAHTILVMNKGDIVEQGNHQELMAKNGFYADLYNSQFTNASAAV